MCIRDSREPGENILDTAKRELWEETGAVEFDLNPVCIYGVTRETEITYGLLCFANIQSLGELPPEMEIGEIKQFDTLPKELTYPAIQPYLFERVNQMITDKTVWTTLYNEAKSKNNFSFY